MRMRVALIIGILAPATVAAQRAAVARWSSTPARRWISSCVRFVNGSARCAVRPRSRERIVPMPGRHERREFAVRVPGWTPGPGPRRVRDRRDEGSAKATVLRSAPTVAAAVGLRASAVGVTFPVVIAFNGAHVLAAAARSTNPSYLCCAPREGGVRVGQGTGISRSPPDEWRSTIRRTFGGT
jgi:hypothetical protein